MKYMFAKRYEEGPVDLLRLKDNVDKLIIEAVLIHNDHKMKYIYDDERKIYTWSQGRDEEYLIYFQHATLQKNNYDKILEFDSDAAAMLYYEVKDEL